MDVFSTKKRVRIGRRGVSLVELMIAMSILSIGVLGFVSAFGFITKSIRVSRAHTLATNLAQEKVENLKNISYYKLALTTATVEDDRFNPSLYYDVSNYSKENISIGGITFERATVVSLAEVTNGVITATAFDYPDTGLKYVTVYIIWSDRGNWKYKTLNNIYENPNVDPLTARITGKVTGGMGTIEDVYIKIVEQPDWNDTTDSSGDYDIAVSPGEYSINASSSGYYSQTLTQVDVSSGGVVTKNFTLAEIGVGTVMGRAWINDGLVIAHVCLASKTFVGNGAEQLVEFVELYNPTTYPINIGDEGAPGDKTHYLNFYDEDGAFDDKADSDFNFVHLATYMAPNAYYLYANATFFWMGPDLWINSDAYYAGKYMGYQEAGALQLVDGGGTIIDTVGWNDNDDTAPRYEGSPIPDMDQSGGDPGDCVQDGQGGWSFVRWSSAADIVDEYGPSYDSGDNSVDFISGETTCKFTAHASIHVPMIVSGISNSTETRPNIVGKPAFGATVSADDLLAPAATADRVTYTKEIFAGLFIETDVAQYELEGVSTGTWNIVIASGSYNQTISTVVVTEDCLLSIPNSVTDPAWVVADYDGISLDSESAKGFVGGFVQDTSGNPISGINVLASGESKTTGPNGRYFAAVTTGTIYIIANPNNANPAYVEMIEQADLDVGDVVSQDFILYEGGVFEGFMTTDGNSLLPNVQVAASRDGTQYSLGTSDSSGKFYLRNLSTGTYDVAPVMDPMDTWTPIKLTSAIVPGENLFIGTFTITGALGTIWGAVEYDDVDMTSGALILVSTHTLPSTPPAIVASSSPAQAVIYAASSLADGTYEIDVRGSTSTTYSLSIYVPVISGGVVSITTKTYDGISVAADSRTQRDIAIP